MTLEIQKKELTVTAPVPVSAPVSAPAIETTEKKDGYNPAVGIPATLLSQLCISLSRVGVKYLYHTHPAMVSTQLLLYRAAIALAFTVVWLNVKLKKEMYTSVRRELVC